MRASSGAPHEEGGRHLTGAERLVPPAKLEATVLELLRRAADRGAADEHIQISIDPVLHIERANCLSVTTVKVPEATAAQALAASFLRDFRITDKAIAVGVRLLTEGFDGRGTPMRGAAVLSSETGARLDPDPRRGVRASRFDYAPEIREQVQEALTANGLGHFRTLEALAVATKVLWSGVSAEYCWSDDPEYCAGYIADVEAGYMRFPEFKPAGAVGGRIFFVHPANNPKKIIERLETRAVLITTVPRITVLDVTKNA